MAISKKKRKNGISQKKEPAHINALEDELLGDVPDVKFPGRGGDDRVALLNAMQQRMLKKAGGSGKKNPDTGLKSFEFGDDNSRGYSDYGGMGDPGVGTDEENDAVDENDPARNNEDLMDFPWLAPSPDPETQALLDELLANPTQQSPEEVTLATKFWEAIKSAPERTRIAAQKFLANPKNVMGVVGGTPTWAAVTLAEELSNMNKDKLAEDNYGKTYKDLNSLERDEIDAQFDSRQNGPVGVGEAGFETNPIMQELRTRLPQLFDSNILDRGSRDTLLNDLIGQALTSVENPGLDPTEFESILRSGFLSEDQSLGEQTNLDLFKQLFNDPAQVGRGVLSKEEQNRRSGFINKLKGSFPDPSKAFSPISDDEAINRILDERQQPVFEEVSNLEARGALNQTGGRTAKQVISGQRDTANKRLQDIGSSVRSRYSTDLEGIRGEGETAAQNYSLGQELFNEQPFVERGQSLVDERSKNLEGDIRTQLGQEPLFSSQEAIHEAGRTQGVVSGKPSSNSLLDVIAARGLTDEARKRRGIGSRGSGVF